VTILLLHQAELRDNFLNRLKYKGVVALHKLGLGKSCSSILISDEILKVKKVFVMPPVRLRDNFIEEDCSKCVLKKYYTFIRTNNMEAHYSSHKNLYCSCFCLSKTVDLIKLIDFKT